MASLTPSRSAMSLSRPSLLRRTLVPRRANLTFMRERTALQENDEPLNQNPTDSDIDQAKPRWSYTPPALKAAYDFQLKEAKDPRNSVWHVNEDPAKLEAFYERFLGARSGARMLPEELRWLAVTHKSFDYGRRGFNTKLAYFGMLCLLLLARVDGDRQPGTFGMNCIADRGGIRCRATNHCPRGYERNHDLPLACRGLSR